METVTLTINGLKVKAKRGTKILWAALDSGIYIPNLCAIRGADLPFGACRLCWVEVEGQGVVTACTEPVRQGMMVHTDTPQVQRLRRAAFEFILSDHPILCRSCGKNWRCELQRIAAFLKVPLRKPTRLRELPEKSLPIDESNPFFIRDMNKCILCGKCVWVCNEWCVVGAIDFAFHGYGAMVSTFDNVSILESRCESCGECVAVCPVGALLPKQVQIPTQEVKTICPYCSLGCGLYLGVHNGKVVEVKGDRENPINCGSLCVRGRFGLGFVHHPDRLSSPLIRQNGQWVEVSWEEAIEEVAEKFSAYEGLEAAVISSPKATNEANYIAQKFARTVLRTNNIDNSARFCYVPTLYALSQTLGVEAAIPSLDEVNDAACIVVIGANVTVSHPVLGARIKRASRKGAKLIVVNPRYIGLCDWADLWLRPHPGTDVALLMGLIYLMVDRGLVAWSFIRDYCRRDFESFCKSLLDFTPEAVELISGVSKEQLLEAGQILGNYKPAFFLYNTGLTHHAHATDNILALINLALVTGNIGLPSAGVHPLLGQNNSQGACDMGVLPDFYPGYQPVANPAAREKMAADWGCPLNETPGLTLIEIFEAARKREVKALYLIGANPLLSIPNTQKVREALEHLEFLVVQDIFLNETTQFADVVLPAASFAEVDGTFTNTERRVQRVRRAIDPVGNSRPDWWITCQIAKRLGAKGFDFESPSHIMDEIAQVVPIYRGITYERLEDGGVKWPLLVGMEPRLLKAELAQERGRCVPLRYRPPVESVDKEYPLILITECNLYQQGVLSRKVEGLNTLSGEEVMEINPEDADSFGVMDGVMVRVISRRGKVVIKAKVTEATPRGVVSMGSHSSRVFPNMLTDTTLDSVAKTPELQVCAVRVEHYSSGGM